MTARAGTRTGAFAANVAALAFLVATGAAAGAVRSDFDARPLGGTLTVTSDSTDAIVVTCEKEALLVNGRAPDSGPAECNIGNAIIEAGPGDDLIDLSEIEIRGSGRFRYGSATIDAGPGDDRVFAPRATFLTIRGGPGSDYLKGNSTSDRYLFEPANSPETDIISEPGQSTCRLSHHDTNQPGLTYYFIDWDAFDFSELRTDDPVRFDAHAPNGVIASHTNRTIEIVGAGGEGSIESVRGGAGDDTLLNACMADGGPGHDELSGTSRGDLLIGGAGKDTLHGRSGPDMLRGGHGKDILRGGADADTLSGEAGSDQLAGNSGDDVYLFQSSERKQTDTVSERPRGGHDVLSFDLPEEIPATVDLGKSGVIARAGKLRVAATTTTAVQVEGIIGGRGNDRLFGNQHDNVFWSGGGRDLFAGRDGDDHYVMDWVPNMPPGAYGWFQGFTGGWLDRGPNPSTRSPHPSNAPESTVRIAERRNAGTDTVDFSPDLYGYIGQSQLEEPNISEADRLWFVREGAVRARVARAGQKRHLERLLVPD